MCEWTIITNREDIIHTCTHTSPSPITTPTPLPTFTHSHPYHTLHTPYIHPTYTLHTPYIHLPLPHTFSIMMSMCFLFLWESLAIASISFPPTSGPRGISMIFLGAAMDEVTNFPSDPWNSFGWYSLREKVGNGRVRAGEWLWEELTSCDSAPLEDWWT